MNELFLIIAILLAVRVARGGDITSPAAVMVFVCALSMVVFYGVTVLWIYPDWVSHWWQVRSDYRDVSVGVLGFYLLLLSLGFCVERLTKRLRRLDLPYAADLRSSANFASQVDKLLTHPAIVFALVCTTLLSVWHFWTINFSELMFYRVYTSARDPYEVGIQNAIVGLFHKNVPMLGCILGPMAMLYFHRRRMSAFFLAATVFVYAFVITVSFCSRFAVLQLFLLAVLARVLNNRRVSAGAVSFACAAFVTYAVTIVLRKGLGADRVGPLGIEPFVDVLFSGDFLFDQMLLFTLFNNFGGAFVLAESLSRWGVTYPLKYKILSFSPFPSMIDGFNTVRYAEERIMATGPFSNFAELYHFGPLYVVGFLIFLFCVLYIVTRWWRLYRGGFAFVVCAPMYYAIFSMHYYPLRHSTRWILASTIAAVSISYMYEYRSRLRVHAAHPARSGRVTRGVAMGAPSWAAPGGRT